MLVWRLLRSRRASATGQFWVTHIRAATGLLLGLAWDNTSQPSSTLSTVAILAQGTIWADALLRAFFSNGGVRHHKEEKARPPTLGAKVLHFSFLACELGLMIQLSSLTQSLSFLAWLNSSA